MKRRPGATLLEAMVALTLLGLIWLAGQQALALVRQAAADPGDGGDTFILVRQVQDWLAAAQPVRTGRRRNAPLLFQGEAGRIAFVSDLPARFGQGGPHLLALWPGDAGVVLEWSPLRPTPPAGATDRRRQRLVLPGRAELRLRYRADAAGPWHDRWEDPATLPTLVELTLGPAGQSLTVVTRLRMGG